MNEKLTVFLVMALLFLCGSTPLHAQQASHQLGPLDQIEVTVFKEPDLASKVTLDKEGKASFSLIGEVSLAGLTTEAAARMIAARYDAGYLVNPKVTVALVKEARKTFTVIGAVNKPQSYYLPEGKSGITLLKAVGMAGGFNRLANKKKLLVIRAGRKDPIVVSGDAATNFQIQPDDVIEVRETIF